MADNVGSMEVEYSVIVDEAIKNLNRYNKMIERNEAKQQKQAKADKERKDKYKTLNKIFGKENIKTALKMKKSFIAIAATLAIVVGGLYALIRASSYGAIYAKQFGATTQQIANTIMEKTGLNNTLGDLTTSYQLFADTFEEQGFLAALLESLINLNAWIADHILTPFRDAGAAVGRFFKNIGDKGLWEAIKILAGEFGRWIWEKLGTVFPRITGAIERFWNLIKDKDWKQLAIDTFGKIKDWIKDNIIDKAKDWAIRIMNWLKAGLEEKIDKVKELIPDNIKEAIKTLIDKAKQFGIDIITKIKEGIESIPIIIKIQTVLDKVKDLIGWGSSTEQHEWDKPAAYSGISGAEQLAKMQKVNDAIITPNGQVIKTNPADYLIATKTPGDLGGKGDTYNISPTININSGTGNGLTNDMSRQISKSIAEEIKRIVKV